MAGQYAAVDENLTANENLELVGRLYHLSKKEARRRANALLEKFALTHAAKRPLKTYSRGMRRRLDLAASLIGKPTVLFLDEPTTGLDPRSRIGLWNVIKELVAEGTTLLLTTQYLEEADQLADRIVVINHGKIIAQGTSNELKARVGGDMLNVEVSDRTKINAAVTALQGMGTAQTHVDNEAQKISLPVLGGFTALAEAVRRLDQAQIPISNLALSRPSLDDVFLALTGHSAEENSPES